MPILFNFERIWKAGLTHRMIWTAAMSSWTLRSRKKSQINAAENDVGLPNVASDMSDLKPCAYIYMAMVASRRILSVVPMRPLLRIWRGICIDIDTTLAAYFIYLFHPFFWERFLTGLLSWLCFDSERLDQWLLVWLRTRSGAVVYIVYEDSYTHRAIYYTRVCCVQLRSLTG